MHRLAEVLLIPPKARVTKVKGRERIKAKAKAKERKERKEANAKVPLAGKTTGMANGMKAITSCKRTVNGLPRTGRTAGWEKMVTLGSILPLVRPVTREPHSLW